MIISKNYLQGFIHLYDMHFFS